MFSTASAGTLEAEKTSAIVDYSEGFSLAKFLPRQSTGIISARDDLVVDFDKSSLALKISDFLNPKRSDDFTREKYYGNRKQGKYLPGDSRGWRLSEKRSTLQGYDCLSSIREINYRPLDSRWIVYDQNIVDWPRFEMMAHFNDGANFALLSPRMTSDDFSPLVTTSIISNKTASRYDQTYFFPLYLYPSPQDLDQTRRVNFDPTLYKRLQTLANHPTHGTPDEVQTFDYIYGVLHCPGYRATYAEFLKIDFPRIPWPATPDEFRDISAKGSTLRKLHLMDPATIGPTPYPFKGEGNAVVEKPEFRDGKVWINKTQYFDAAPEVSWGFYIGGYQPAQKWLKDRKTRALTFDDVKHYQRILKILSETARIMATITMTLDTGAVVEA